METDLGYVVRMNEQGVITLFRETAVKTVTLSALARSAAEARRDKTQCTPVLPSGEGACRIYAETDVAVGFLMQCNPSIRTLHYVVRRDSDRYDFTRDTSYRDSNNNLAYLFKVSMPWIWVMCKFYKKDGQYQWRRCFLCATYRNLESMDDDVYVAPVPNQWGRSGLMCTGDIINEDVDTKKPGTVCRKFLFKLFDSYFNDDLMPSMPRLVCKGNLIQTLGEWERVTSEHPGIGLNPDFGMTRYGTLDDFIQNSMGGQHDDDRE